MVTEFMNRGSIKSYLRSKTKSDIHPSDICMIGKEIASGMEYLGSLSVIHRDLRADNVLVNEEDGQEFSVKIADFGLSRKTVTDSYYTKSGISADPIKWSAPEIFVGTGRASTKSDIWSFGVLLWEIFQLCNLDPYPDLTNSQVKKKVQNGEKMIQFMNMEDFPDGISNIIEKCLSFMSCDRPTFSESQKEIDLLKEKIILDGNKWKMVKKALALTVVNSPYSDEYADGDAKLPAAQLENIITKEDTNERVVTEKLVELPYDERFYDDDDMNRGEAEEDEVENVIEYSPRAQRK